MHPSYFGRETSPLFGIHHPPLGATHRAAGVVLCHPGPYEYMWTHWAMRRLADMLAREGFDVLRFDFHATGDSSGASHEASPRRWREDVKTAVAELQALTGVRKVSAIGLRLGAVAAAEACAEGLPLDALVLWNPVVKGANYLRALRAAEAQRTARSLYPPEPVEGRRTELLGLPLPISLESELSAIDLAALAKPLTERVVLVAGSQDPAFDLLERAWSDRGAKIERRQVDDAASARPVVDGALLSHVSLLALTAAMTEAAS